MDGVSDRDFCMYFLHACSMTSIHLGKLSSELILWSSNLVGLFNVHSEYSTGSSIMPQKRNPVPLEHLRLKLSLAGGGADQIINTMHNTPFADMNDSERETQAAGFAVFERFNKALPLLAGFVDSIKIDKVSISKRINESMATITELADHLARTEEISFRLAHSVAHKLAYQALSLETSLDDLDVKVFKREFEEVVGRQPNTDEKTFRKICSPENFISVRKMSGGPAPSSTKTPSAISDRAPIKQLSSIITGPA